MNRLFARLEVVVWNGHGQTQLRMKGAIGGTIFLLELSPLTERSNVAPSHTAFLSFIHYNIYSGYMGASSCMILASWGSAWGTWRSGLGLCSMGTDHPAGIIKCVVPIVMAGVLGIYGLIVSVIITQAIVPPNSYAFNTYSSYNGYTHVSHDHVLACSRIVLELHLTYANTSVFSINFSLPQGYAAD